jgi:hypothetical protein
MFNPLTQIPTTDEEAESALSYGRDELTGKSLVGIFQVRRAQSDSLLEAYEAALVAHAEAAGYGHLLSQHPSEASPQARTSQGAE